MEILRVEGLCKRYPAFELKNVSFSMQAGMIMGFIGRNGAGKTTTLKSILHFVHPDAGKITLLGMDMDTQERQIKEQLGFVSGGIHYYPKKRLCQLTDATRHFYERWDEALYRQCLQRFHLQEDKRVEQLSEGMKVKYQLAVAMSHHAKLLIFDEPTSGLDPVSRDDLLDLFLTLVEEDGASILFSTHITSDLDKCADHITYIMDGKLVASEKKTDFLAAYKAVKGTPDQLTPALDAALIGAKKHRDSFSGLLRAQDAPLAAVCAVTDADLETVMVHLEKEGSR